MLIQSRFSRIGLKAFNGHAPVMFSECAAGPVQLDTPDSRLTGHPGFFLVAALLVAGMMLLASCGDGNPKVAYLDANPPAAPGGSTQACTTLASLFPGFTNGGVGSDTFTLNGVPRVDSATCDPLVLSSVDPDTQDLQVNLLWGWIDPTSFFANHVFISLWGRTLGLTPGTKNIVNYASAANAVNEFRYDSAAQSCQPDFSLGPSITYTSIGAVGGTVAGSFTNISMVVNGTLTPCAIPTLTGTFTMIRDPDDADGGSGSVANPIQLIPPSGPVAGTLNGSAASSGSAFYKFVAGNPSRTLSVTGATIDIGWQLFSSPDFINQVFYCDSIPGAGDESCTVGGLNSATTYYLQVRSNGGGSTGFNVSVN